jgi:hypothetical protein
MSLAESSIDVMHCAAVALHLSCSVDVGSRVWAQPTTDGMLCNWTLDLSLHHHELHTTFLEHHSSPPPVTDYRRIGR